MQKCQFTGIVALQLELNNIISNEIQTQVSLSIPTVHVTNLFANILPIPINTGHILGKRVSVARHLSDK